MYAFISIMSGQVLIDPSGRLNDVRFERAFFSHRELRLSAKAMLRRRAGIFDLRIDVQTRRATAHPTIK